jgi:hypothetical protein
MSQTQVKHYVSTQPVSTEHHCGHLRGRGGMMAHAQRGVSYTSRRRYTEQRIRTTPSSN